MDEFRIECLEDHQFKVGNDELPIELIYRLLEKNDVAVKDLFISNVTDEYLRIIREQEQTENYSLDKMCDFAKFAARLLYLKLKRASAVTEEEIILVEEEERLIIDRINEYKMFQDASLILRSKETLGKQYREPQYTEEDRAYVVNNLTMDMLVTAYAQILHTIELGPKTKLNVKTITKDKHTVKDRVMHIVDTLGVYKTMYFDELYEKGSAKEEVITTFLALLELIKIRFATAEQQDAGRIKLTMQDDAAVNLEVFRTAKTDDYEENSDTKKETDDE